MERRNRSYIGIWARLEQVSCIGQDVQEPSTESPKSKMKAPTTRIFEMPGPLLIEAQAAFDPSIGIAGLYHRNDAGQLEPRKTILDLSFAFLRSSSTFGKDDKLVTTSTGIATGGLLSSSIKIRLNSLLEVVQRLNDTFDPHPQPHFGPHLGPHLHARYSSDENGRAPSPHSRAGSESPWRDTDGSFHAFDASADLPPIPSRRNPAAMLKSIAFMVPMIKVETTLPELPETSPTVITAPRQIKSEVRMRGLAVQVVVNKTLDSSDRHLHWFGRNAALKLAVKAGFEKFDIDAAAMEADSSESSPLASQP